MSQKNFIGILVILFLINAAIYYWLYFSKDVSLKRKILPWLIYLQFMIIPAVAFFSTWSPLVLIVGATLAIGVAYLNLKQIAFCDACAAMQYNKYSRPDSCRKCGAGLEYLG
jgi:hypothetical protein